MRSKWMAGVAASAALSAGLWACHPSSADGAAGKTDGKAGEAKGSDSKSSGGKGSDATARVVPVVAAIVVQKDVPVALDGLGSVVAYNTVTVQSLVPGRLVSVLFKEGQAVHKGQLLAEIDPRPYEVALHQAEGALVRDQASLKDDQLNLDRDKDLLSKKLVAPQVVDDQTALVGQMEGAIIVDKATISSAKLNLEYAHITSPIDGITGIRQVDVGNLIQTSTTAMVIVTQLDPVSVYITLPEDALPGIADAEDKAGAAASLVVDAFTRDGLTHLGTGKLLLVDNEINQATATLKLKAVFPNPKHVLWPNQFVKARLTLSTEQGALVVPATAVQRGPEGTFVYLVGADKTVSSRPVDVERTEGDLTVLAKSQDPTRGVEVGDEVVTDGQTNLRVGSKVKDRMANAPAPTYAEQQPGHHGKAEKPQ